MKRLLSGNESIALGAYWAGVSVAAAYPGTPSTEILEEMAKLDGVYAEWAPNEKVAMEVGLGAAYAGVRAMVSMKHVGLNVAADPFFAASQTGVPGGLVVVSADDPGMHSSQNEQDNRHYAKFAKVPLLEPTDSQGAYDLMPYAFQISEEFDTPVLFRTTTRISHSKSVVEVDEFSPTGRRAAEFGRDSQKYVMIPANARRRHPLMEERLEKLAAYAETFPLNEEIYQDHSLGIIASGVAYQHAREVFPNASFLKLCLSFPLPEKMVRRFAASVDRLIVVEELDPFLEESVRLLELPAEGKRLFPIIGELSVEKIEQGARLAGLLDGNGRPADPSEFEQGLPVRPPVLCPGCPHAATFYVLKRLGFADPDGGPASKRTGLIVTGDIGCYTLGVLPPLQALDTTGCMGASIGNALGMEKAGIKNKVVAVIGDSTFVHSGITPLIDVVYNQGTVTTIILDNSTTAMTGHQDHPGTGVSAKGVATTALDLERLARGVGVENVHVVSAFDLEAIESTVTASVENPQPSVVIVRGPCALKARVSGPYMVVDAEKCNGCGACVRVGCPAIALRDKKGRIDPSMCVGPSCGVCGQVCPLDGIHVSSPVGAVGVE